MQNPLLLRRQLKVITNNTASPEMDSCPTCRFALDATARYRNVEIGLSQMCQLSHFCRDPSVAESSIDIPQLLHVDLMSSRSPALTSV